MSSVFKSMLNLLYNRLDFLAEERKPWGRSKMCCRAPASGVSLLTVNKTPNP